VNGGADAGGRGGPPAGPGGGTPPAAGAGDGVGAPPLSASARRVQEAIRSLGFANDVFELAEPVRTAADAARAVGCDVAQIVKSIVFRAARSGRGVLVLTSGANRVDEARVAELLGEPLGKADPAFVRERTGFAIGGVPPLGHATPFVTFLDEDLLSLGRLWAAAGHPNSLFPVTPDELARMTGGRIARVK
jgi:prolyl-tRNA editing enzyme YbaK/EbsC (Cys-tRNA(Pro) deacylase)